MLPSTPLVLYTAKNRGLDGYRSHDKIREKKVFLFNKLIPNLCSNIPFYLSEKINKLKII